MESMGAMLAQREGGDPIADGAAAASVGGGALVTWSRDPWCSELRLEVLSRGEDAGGPWLDLPDTLLYPGGGGQPPDAGWVDGRPVKAVAQVAGGWRHHLQGGAADGSGGLGSTAADGIAVGNVASLPSPGHSVLVRLDWPRRFDHMQQHSGQHLLSAIAEDRFGWRTTSFHLGPEVSDIELAVPALNPEQLHHLEEAVAEAIHQAYPIQDRWVDPGALAVLQVRSRGLPAGHRGLVRLVEIAGIDLATCGGTHLSSLAQLEALALLGTESMRGGTRLQWVAGCRLRRRLSQHEQRLAGLRQVLKAPDHELVDALDRLRSAAEEQRQAGLKQAAWLAEFLAARLAEDRRPWPWLHDARLGRDLQRDLGKRLLEIGRAAFLSGGEAPFAWLLVVPPGAQAPQPPDPAALRHWIEGLGRGGGRAPFIQGQATGMEALAQAAEVLAVWAGT